MHLKLSGLLDFFPHPIQDHLTDGTLAPEPRAPVRSYFLVTFNPSIPQLCGFLRPLRLIDS